LTGQVRVIELICKRNKSREWKQGLYQKQYWQTWKTFPLFLVEIRFGRRIRLGKKHQAPMNNFHPFFLTQWFGEKWWWRRR
jgi:hypothetical protein